MSISENLREALASSPVGVVTVIKPTEQRTELIIMDTQEQVDARVALVRDRALREGHIVRSNGREEHIRREAVWVERPDGGREHEWHEDGDRVRVRRVLVSKLADGTQEERVVGTSWVLYDRFWGSD